MYFVKSFINHGVHAQPHFIPIVIPNYKESARIKEVVGRIIGEQKNDAAFDYRPLREELDVIVYDMYNLSVEERAEIETWYRRHYPKLDPANTGTGDEAQAGEVD